MNSRVVRVELDRAPNESHRLIESIGAGAMAPDDPINVTVGGVNLENTGYLGLEIADTILQIRHSGNQRP